MPSSEPASEEIYLLRVDMTEGRVAREPLPEAWTLLGGRALTSRILLEECDAGCDPLGPENLLIRILRILPGTDSFVKSGKMRKLRNTAPGIINLLISDRLKRKKPW